MTLAILSAILTRTWAAYPCCPNLYALLTIVVRVLLCVSVTVGVLVKNGL